MAVLGRGLLNGTLGAAIVLLLSGCTVEPHAVLGIGIGTDGSPVGFLQVCSEQIDGATVYRTENDHLGKWSVTPSATGFATWSFASGGNGWSVVEPFVKVGQTQEYIFYGWTRDNTASAEHIAFTLADLATMKPGQVRYWSGHADSVGKIPDDYVVGTVAEFKEHGCDRFS